MYQSDKNAERKTNCHKACTILYINCWSCFLYSFFLVVFSCSISASVWHGNMLFAELLAVFLLALSSNGVFLCKYCAFIIIENRICNHHTGIRKERQIRFTKTFPMHKKSLPLFHFVRCTIFYFAFANIQTFA